MMSNDESFTGYLWSYFGSIADKSLKSRAENFIHSTNWDALVEYATAVRNGRTCRLLQDIGLGLNHMVRVIEFDDNVRWIARLRMPFLSSKKDPNTAHRIMEHEYNTMLLIKQKTKIPIPHVHAIELDPECRPKAQFLLMDCLRGNAGIDLGLQVPSNYKHQVFTRMAEIQIELSRVQLPKIGTILRQNPDGSFEQGPIPGIGGPFETASDFFKAWSARAEFGLSEERLRAASGEWADEIWFSALSFKLSIDALAGKISARDKGPFPLCHGDFGHNNMIFDNKYNLLGVIDWESAFAGPWEIFGEIPLTLSTIPPEMDAPWNYDENGSPRDQEGKQRFADREEYIKAVMGKENVMGLTNGYRLSMALQDTSRQYLATAMRLYQGGKVGWYSKVVDRFSRENEC